MKGHPGAAFLLEMSAVASVRRTISAMSGVTTKTMRTGKMQDDNWPKFTNAIEQASAIPVYMSDYSGWTTSGIRVELERMIGLYHIEWVLVDYEALLCDDPDKEDNTRSKTISSRLHGIIKDLHLAGLVVDDMNKEGIKTNGGIGKASLAGSARKIYDADSIWVLKENKDTPGTLNLVSEKLREGDGVSNRVIPLMRTNGIPEFKNVTKRYDNGLPNLR
jgi:replicative DNA helicase